MFYATAFDLGCVLDEIEARQPLQYTLTGLFPDSDLRIHFSYSEIEGFGHAPHPTAVANPSYLVARRETSITSVEVPQKERGVLFAVDQRSNPDTIVLRPGGRHGNEVILCGMVGSVSSTPISKQLYKDIAASLRKRFRRQHEFLVGHEASAIWNAGVRLTIGAMAPPNFDLRH
jgi:hypothetical protein